jgi:hypothetical protein
MPRQISNRALLFIGLGYFLLLAGVIAAMIVARNSVMTSMDTPEAQQAWNDWRAEAAKEDGAHGPVQRSVPRSGEPPSLVLMRDYFAVSTVGLLVPVSALYGFFAWVLCGVMNQSPLPAGRGER